MGVPPQVWHAGDAAGAAAAPPLLCCLLLPRGRQLLRQAHGRLGKGCGLRRRAGALQSGGSGKGAQARCRGRGAALRAPECRRCCWLVGSGPACLSQPPVDPVSLLVAPLSCCVSCLFQSPPAFSPQALSCCCAALPQADVPAEVRQGLDVVACSRLEDVLAAAFDPPIRLAPQPLLARL